MAETSIKIKLVRMGMDLYGENKKWDMGNYRVRPTMKDATECLIRDKDGVEFGGDFGFWEKNKTNNKAGDTLHWDFTYYDKDGQGWRYKKFDKYYDKHLEPTLANIKMMLEDIIGKKVELELEERSK